MTIALDWPTQLAPIWTDDLGDFVAAVATMWNEVEAYQADPENGVAAWQPLFDVDLAPTEALPWLAQCVGERLPVGISDAGARNWIRTAPNWMRGTPQAIVDGLARVLAPGATVHVRMSTKSDGSADPDYIWVLTYASQTPDPQLVRNQLRRTVPGDIVWEYQNVTDPTWLLAQEGIATWGDFAATYATWDAVLIGTI